MKKIFFAAAVVAAFVIMVAVGQDPMEYNPMDNENGAFLLFAAMCAVLAAVAAPVFNMKVRIGLYVVTGVFTLLCGWTMAFVYSFFAAFMWLYIKGNPDVEKGIFKFFKNIITEEETAQ